ncbi:MAG: electron transport complex subunit A [Acidobacteria bacterium]|nr:electron transport complex subunit A [Acidobacteriota bacterium]
MNNESLSFILIDSLLLHNFVLSVFLGMCSFIGISGKRATAVRLSLAVTFVITMSSILCYFTNRLLVQSGTEYLRIILYIVIIAAMVQLTEMFIKKTNPSLFRQLGIFLPLITTNCAVLAVPLFQTSRGYSLLQSVVFAVGASGGYTLAMYLMSEARERLELSDLPDLSRGAVATLTIAGILSLAFMGFSGMGGE